MKRKSYDTNRSITKRPHKTGGWCPCCDGALVFDGQRCPNCGKRIKPYRFKKPIL